MELFVLVDVGCIECDESTEVVGVYHDRQEARAALRAEAVKRDKSEASRSIADDEDEFAYFVGGQRCLEVHATKGPRPGRRGERAMNGRELVRRENYARLREERYDLYVRAVQLGSLVACEASKDPIKVGANIEATVIEILVQESLEP